MIIFISPSKGSRQHTHRDKSKQNTNSDLKIK